MPAYTATTRDLASALTGQPIRPGYAALRDVITIYDNDDSVSRRYAEEAMNAGHAAYWTSASYHNGVACMLCDRANLIHDLPGAIATLHVIHREGDALVGFLDRLIPLNQKAAEELSLAYAGTGTWRDVEELEMRRVRDCRKAVA